MIYFLVNNDTHLIDSLICAKQLERRNIKCALIVVRHTIDKAHDTSLFAKVINFDRLFKKSIDYFNVANFIKIKLSINRDLKIDKDDALVFFTEYEFTNCLLVNYFNKLRKRVYLLEEGIATYLNFKNIESPLKLNFRLRFKQFLLRLYSIDVRLHDYGGVNYPVIDNKYITSALFYYPLKTDRKVNVCLITKNLQNTPTKNNHIVFLNQPLYMDHLPFAKYISIINKVINSLSSQFEKVYFKAHPRDRDEILTALKDNFSEIRNVLIMRDKQPIEALVASTPVEYACSFYSTALFNLHQLGVKPIFIFHFFSDLNEHIEFKQTKEVLSVQGYKFPNSIDNLKSEKFGFGGASFASETCADIIVSQAFPLVSIVVVTFNCVESIEMTLASIINQNYENIEIIVIDGKSTDGTIEVIKKYLNKITHFVSEADAGIYDAMNKGLKLSRGSWINFMNSGDFFSTDFSISDFVSEFDTKYALVASGALIIDGTRMRVQKPKHFSKYGLFKSICHQAIFHNSKYIKEFDLRYRLCADFDLQCKLYSASNDCFVKFIDKNLVTYLAGGVSDRSEKLRIAERHTILSLNLRGFIKYLNLANNYRIKLKYILRSIIKA